MTVTAETVVPPALAASEAHQRACNVCFLNVPEGACPEGKRLAGIASRQALIDAANERMSAAKRVALDAYLTVCPVGHRRCNAACEQAHRDLVAALHDANADYSAALAGGRR